MYEAIAATHSFKQTIIFLIRKKLQVLFTSYVELSKVFYEMIQQEQEIKNFSHLTIKWNLLKNDYERLGAIVKKLILLITVYSTYGFGNSLENVECVAENKPMVKYLYSDFVTFYLIENDVTYSIIVDARFQGLDILGAVNLSNTKTFFGGGFDSRGLFSYSSHLSNGRFYQVSCKVE